jgi:hypothetical protein
MRRAAISQVALAGGCGEAMSAGSAPIDGCCSGRAGLRINKPLKRCSAHPHMLRHACGYALANRGTTPGRFRGGWGTDRLHRRRFTRRWRRTGSRTSGGNERVASQSRKLARSLRRFDE